MRKLFALFLLLGCSEPMAPSGAVPILPVPQIYRDWWDDLESCSGLSGDMGRVLFFVVPSIPDHPERAAQTTVRSGSRSTILFVRGHESTEWVVKHEMMHALLRDVGHPPLYFRELCGNLDPTT